MLRFRAVPTNDDFTSGSMSSLFLSLKKTAKRLARGDYDLQDDLVSVAWTRILQYKNKSYTVQQFHVVGVNSMKRELQKHIKHATGDSKNNNTPKRVELQDQLVYVDDCALRIDVQAVIDHMDKTTSAIFAEFLRDPDSSVTDASKRVGFSPATACRSCAKTRKTFPVLDPRS